MPRVNKPRVYQVRLTNHGYDQYVYRMKKMGVAPLERRRLERSIMGRFNDRIGAGITVDHTMAVKISVSPGLDAVIRPKNDHWVVTTFLYWFELAGVGLGA